MGILLLLRPTRGRGREGGGGGFIGGGWGDGFIGVRQEETEGVESCKNKKEK